VTEGEGERKASDDHIRVAFVESPPQFLFEGVMVEIDPKGRRTAYVTDVAREGAVRLLREAADTIEANEPSG
jgi:hypothetical protein